MFSTESEHVDLPTIVVLQLFNKKDDNVVKCAGFAILGGKELSLFSSGP